jgi:lipopolysaccharide/colanic/teichoic acid biosynthesis glycosyltransferase
VAARDEPARELIGARAAHARARREVLVQVQDPHATARNGSRRLLGGGERALGRALDMSVAALLLLLASPLLLAAAAAIKLESPGPALYRQRRVGKDGVPFDLWKLRTMVPGAQEMGAGIYVLEGDPRITRVGRALRRVSLDELPNLINVLKGEMALVGPRPTIQEQVDHYTARQRRRLEVKPGITGWAQVHGRAALPWPERIELDVWYVDNRSLRLDLRILGRTVRLLLSGRGLYSDDPKQGWGGG